MEKKNFYIEPKKLMEELKSYQKTEIISNELGEMLLLLARETAKKSNLIERAYNKEDCIGNAVLRMIKYLSKIKLDHPKCNPFGYLTQICINSFKSTYNDENRQKKIKNHIRVLMYDDIYIDEIDDEYEIN